MPMYVERLTSEVSVTDGMSWPSDTDLERLVTLVAQRIEQRERSARQARRSTTFRQGVTPPAKITE
jgi:hypothetical protein